MPIDFHEYWQGEVHKPGFWSPACNEHEFIFNKARKYEPQTIIEIGACMGWSALTFHRAWPKAQIFSYDICEKIYWNNNAPIGSDTRHLLPDWVIFRTSVTAADLNIPHDLAWIDGNHSSPHAFLDTLLCFRFARFPYTLLWHDIGLEFRPDCIACIGPTQAWKAITAVAPAFGIELDEAGMCRSAHFPYAIDKYQFMINLLREWRVGPELENIPVAHIYEHS
jgi:hypothetical protein